MKKNQKVFVVLGPPGSGKGTQARLLEEKFGGTHIETSKLIEATFEDKEEALEFEGEKYSVKKQKKLWASGELCDPPFVVALLQKEIQRLKNQGKAPIFSGSPRTVFETKKIMPFLDELFEKENINIFFLDIGVEESIFRNSHRRICSLARHPILWHEETKDLTICPLDGSKLKERKLDKPEIIKERYKVFEKRTLPLLSWLEENGFEVKRINGEKTVAEVHEEILSDL